MLHEFIYANGLKQADAIIAKKIGWGIFDHFIIYMGIRNGGHVFIANDSEGGVRWFSESETAELIKQFKPVSIRKFEGNRFERQLAVERAEAELGKSYDLLGFNCEHLANYIQHGVRQSKQVQGLAKGVAFAAGIFLFGAILSEA